MLFVTYGTHLINYTRLGVLRYVLDPLGVLFAHPSQ